MHRIAAHPLVTVFVLALSIRLINLALLSGDDAFLRGDRHVALLADRRQDGRARWHGGDAPGSVMLARTPPWAAVFAGGVLAYVLLINGPIATAKYRMPMEPVLIVLAAIPLARLTNVARMKP